MLGDHRLKIIVTNVVIIIIAVFSMDPIAQDPDYHNFADQRSMINIPNAYNVLSNLQQAHVKTLNRCIRNAYFLLGATERRALPARNSTSRA